MRLDKLRQLFSEYVKDKQLQLTINTSITLSQDTTLKYERVDRYNMNVLTEGDIEQLSKFCKEHDIIFWFGFGLLCVGFQYRGNMRLSAYDSVLPEDRSYSGPEDRKKKP